MLSQLRESGLPVGDANRTLRSSSGLLELLPIYRPSVDYIGTKELVNTLSHWRMLTLAIRRKLYGCRFYSER